MPNLTPRQQVLITHARSSMDTSYLQSMLYAAPPAGFDFTKISPVLDAVRVAQLYRAPRSRSLHFKETELLEIIRLFELQHQGFIASLKLLSWINFYATCRGVGISTDDTYSWQTSATIGTAINYSAHYGIIPITPAVVDILSRAARANGARCPECKSSLHAPVDEVFERCEICGRTREIQAQRQRGRNAPPPQTTTQAGRRSSASTFSLRVDPTPAFQSPYAIPQPFIDSNDWDLLDSSDGNGDSR